MNQNLAMRFFTILFLLAVSGSAVANSLTAVKKLIERVTSLLEISPAERSVPTLTEAGRASYLTREPDRIYYYEYEDELARSGKKRSLRSKVRVAQAPEVAGVSHAIDGFGAYVDERGDWVSSEPTRSGIKNGFWVSWDTRTRSWTDLIPLPRHGLRFETYNFGNHRTEQNAWIYVGDFSAEGGTAYRDVYAHYRNGVSVEIRFYAPGFGSIFSCALQPAVMSDPIRVARSKLVRTEKVGCPDRLGDASSMSEN